MIPGNIQSGTYRIVHSSGGAVIQASNDDPTKLMVWARHAGENQQWIVQQAGKGYTFKNRQHGLYIGLKSTVIASDKSPLHGSEYPIPWALIQQVDGYFITFPENIGRIICSNGYSAENGTPIYVWPSQNEPRSTWKLEKLNDDTEKPASQNETTTRDVQDIIKEKDEALAHAYKANEEIAQLRDQRSQLQIKLLHSELAGLQARMDRLEHSKSQVVSKDEGGTYQDVYGGA